jgi:hypothetical protein
LKALSRIDNSYYVIGKGEAPLEFIPCPIGISKGASSLQLRGIYPGSLGTISENSYAKTTESVPS